MSVRVTRIRCTPTRMFSDKQVLEGVVCSYGVGMCRVDVHTKKLVNEPHIHFTIDKRQDGMSCTEPGAEWYRLDFDLADAEKLANELLRSVARAKELLSGQ